MAGLENDVKDAPAEEENEIEKGERDAAPSSKHEQRGAAHLARIAADHIDDTSAADGAAATAATQRISQVLKSGAKGELKAPDVPIRKEEVDFIVREMLVSKTVAEQALRECHGDVMTATRKLINS